MFNISLKNNHVKKEKINRVLKKISKELSILENIDKGKLGHQELSFIISKANQLGEFKVEHCKELSQIYNFNILKKIDKENNSFSYVFFMFPHKNTKPYYKFLKDYNEDSFEIIQKYSDDNLEKEFKIKTIKLENFVSQLSVAINFNKSYTIDLLTSYYVYRDLKYLIKIKEELNLNNEMWDKLRKSVNLMPGDVYPKKEELDSIFNKIVINSNGLILEKEEDFLKNEIFNLYIKIEGRFPKKEDFIELINSSFLKNKSDLIDLFEQKKDLKYCFIEEDDNSIQYEYLEEIYKSINQLIGKKVLSESKLSTFSLGSSVRISYREWNCINKTIGIESFFYLLEKIKKDHKLIIKSETNKDWKFPILHIINSMDYLDKEVNKKIKNLLD